MCSAIVVLVCQLGKQWYIYYW